MKLRYLLAAFLFAACSSPPSGGELTQSSDTGAPADTATDTAAGECPCPDALTCESGFCVRPEPSDVGRDTRGPVDASDDGTTDVADTSPDATPDTDETTDTSTDASDTTTADTRPHWDAGVNCEPDTKCCADGQPQNSGEACDDGDPSTDRTRCQQGACRACECSDDSKACCDGCFFEDRGEKCSWSDGYECRGGDQNNCGGQVYEVEKNYTCTGYDATCPDEPSSTSSHSAAEPCEDDRECVPTSPPYHCSGEPTSDC